MCIRDRGEVIFGGLGCGLYGMLMFAMITVFLCGLMVGRTPECLGKKIEAREVRWSMVGVLLPGITVLRMSGLAAATEVGRESICNAGPHGLTEILYLSLIHILPGCGGFAGRRDRRLHHAERAASGKPFR